jgi:Peptidase S46
VAAARSAAFGATRVSKWFGWDVGDALILKHLTLALAVLIAPAKADEGMWPFNQFPQDAVRDKHKFEATADFLDRLRLASVRIAGRSGSFVSSNGLLLTSRQAVADCLTQLKHDSRRVFGIV